MIIDTNKLKTDVESWYAKEILKVSTITNDKMAIRTLAKLNREQAEDEEAIKYIEELQRNLKIVVEKKT